jgi:hypothetical protein
MPTKSASKKRLTVGLIAVSVLAVGSLVSNALFFMELKSSQAKAAALAARAATPQPKSDESAAIVSRVRRLMAIPDETPTVATVTDPGRLKDQPFFSNAKLGDKALIFSAAQKVILYDPGADRIINVAPLTVKSATQPGG